MKYKLLIVLPLFIVFSVGSKAQNLTFEQTVDYINEIFKSNNLFYYQGSQGINGYGTNSVKVLKSGRISFCWINTKAEIQESIYGSINLFDIEKFEWDQYKNGEISLYTKSKEMLCEVSGLSKSEGERLFKALMYLKTFCNRSADPFGN